MGCSRGDGDDIYTTGVIPEAMSMQVKRNGAEELLLLPPAYGLCAVRQRTAFAIAHLEEYQSVAVIAHQVDFATPVIDVAVQYPDTFGLQVACSHALGMVALSLAAVVLPLGCGRAAFPGAHVSYRRSYRRDRSQWAL